MTNQNIQCWQEAPLRPALYRMLLATPVKRLHIELPIGRQYRTSTAPSLAKQFDTISGRVRRSNAAKKALLVLFVM